MTDTVILLNSDAQDHPVSRHTGHNHCRLPDYTPTPGAWASATPVSFAYVWRDQANTVGCLGPLTPTGRVVDAGHAEPASSAW